LADDLSPDMISLRLNNPTILSSRVFPRKSTVFLFLDFFFVLSPSAIFTHPPATIVRLDTIGTMFTLFADDDDLEPDGLDLIGLDLEGLEVDGLEVIEVDGLEVEGLEVDGLEVEGLEVEGLEVDGLEVDGLEVEVIEVEVIDVDGLEVDVTNDLEVVGLDTLD